MRFHVNWETNKSVCNEYDLKCDRKSWKVVVAIKKLKVLVYLVPFDMPT